MWSPTTEASLLAYAGVLVRETRGQLGLDARDLLHDAWLAWRESAARGWTDARCAARARFAMQDSMRTWRGDVWDHRTGERTPTVEMPPETAHHRAPPAHRSRLPHRVRRAVRRLPPDLRHALTAWCVLGWSHDIIADAHHIPNGTSASRRHRAVRALRHELGVEEASC